MCSNTNQGKNWTCISRDQTGFCGNDDTSKNMFTHSQCHYLSVTAAMLGVATACAVLGLLFLSVVLCKPAKRCLQVTAQVFFVMAGVFTLIGYIQFSLFRSDYVVESETLQYTDTEGAFYAQIIAYTFVWLAWILLAIDRRVKQRFEANGYYTPLLSGAGTTVVVSPPAYLPPGAQFDPYTGERLPATQQAVHAPPAYQTAVETAPGKDVHQFV